MNTTTQNQTAAAGQNSENITERERTLKTQKIAAGRFAYVPTMTAEGYSIGVAIEGISGYFPTNYHSVDTYEKASLWANQINRHRFPTPEEWEQCQEIISSSFRQNPC